MLQPLDGEGGIFTRRRRSTAALRPAGDRYAPALAARVDRADDQRRRRARVAARYDRRGARRRPRHGLRAHLDGARLMNAVVASGVPAADYARGFDTAWIDFTKGLGAPVGAALAGSRELIDEAWRYKQMLGGAMRQAGIVAAAAPLRARPPRRAAGRGPRQRAPAGRGPRRAARRRDRPATVETNIVIFEVPDAVGRAAGSGRRACSSRRSTPARLRAVTHLDVDRGGIERALDGVRRVCWRSALNAPAHELRRDEQDQAREADLERALRDGVGDHRADQHADAATALRSRAPSRRRTLP